MVALPFYSLDEKIAKPYGYQYIKNPSSLGELIRNKRIKLGQFQKDIAKLFEVSEDCITYWKNNRSVPQIQFYPKIIKFLGYIPFEIDTESFAGKIKMYRYLNGLSSQKMGKILGVDGTTITKWETLKSIPRKECQEGIIKFLKPEKSIAILT